MSKHKVAFVVACNKNQIPKWWQALVREVAIAERDPTIEFVDCIINQTASPDNTKNNLVHSAAFGNRLELTDINRNNATGQVLDTDADWLYWWDDDTAHPPNTLRKLLSLQVPFSSGLYYGKTEPYAPIAYVTNPDQTMKSIFDFTKGQLIECDVVGMGCALIHRSVYEDIKETFDVWLTERHTAVLLPKDTVVEAPLDMGQIDINGSLVRGLEGGDDYYHVQRVRPAQVAELIRSRTNWPFYGMEYSRTEDYWFCTLAAKAGHKPLVDTSINCEHWMDGAITHDHFDQYEFLPAEKEGNDD